MKERKKEREKEEGKKMNTQYPNLRGTMKAIQKGIVVNAFLRK